MITEKVLKSLELDKVLNKVKSYLSLEKSGEILLCEKPAESFDGMRQRLALTKEADMLISSYNADSVASFDDPENILIKAKKLVTLTISEILKIAGLLRSSRLFKAKMGEISDERLTILKEYASALYVDKSFEEECDKCFVSDEQVSDNASSELQNIRKSIRKINEDIRHQLESVLHAGGNSKYIQDFYVTVRNGRYVIPVKAEFKNNIKGMLHDQSSSGATVYIEPEIVVESNNELKLLQIKEAEEIERILQAFTSKVNIAAESLRLTSNTLIKVDIAFAKAKYAHVTKSVYPALNSDGVINIICGRHPLIGSDKIIPVSIKLGKEYKYLIISGPNTGGKTVTLKTCGLFCVMAMCGLYLPASEGSEISFFENIFTDIGDEQSIERNLSTFSSHMKNIIEICENVNAKSLTLIDEIGAGTDPKEGAALALAILSHLVESGSVGIVTTHYSELKEYAFINKGTLNACMEFDPVNLKPTFKLNIGLPGSSNALEISKKLGLKETIISAAYNNLSNEKIIFEKVLKSAEEAKMKAEKNLAETESLKKEYAEKLEKITVQEKNMQQLTDNLMLKAKTDAKRIYAEAAEESESLIKELKRIIDAGEISEQDLSRARQIKNRLSDKRYAEINDISQYENDLIPLNKPEIGQNVYIKSLSKNGVITQVNKDNITINMGGIKINAKISDIFKADKNENKNKANITVVNKIMPQSCATEINLLGKTVLEAIPEIDAFLDNCAISGIKVCKIIHGFGTGLLRKAVWEHLKTQPLVESFRGGKYGEGEKGVTIVTLK
jgi:DNA mismatch repair protein MutS2